MGQFTTDPSPGLNNPVCKGQTNVWDSPPLTPIHRKTSFRTVYMSVRHWLQSNVNNPIFKKADQCIGHSETEPAISKSDKCMGQSTTNPSPPLTFPISKSQTSEWVSPLPTPIHRQTTVRPVYVSVRH